MGSKTRVTFLRDFRGRATGEQFFTAGTTVDLPSWMVGMLRAEGVIAMSEAAPVETGAEALTSASPSPAPALPTKPARKSATKRTLRKQVKTSGDGAD